jgi:Na+(H+)/acetate symporter ActP
VAQVVAFAFGLAAASLFPVIIMGIFNKRMNKWGAIAGMLTGLVFTLGYIIYFKGVFMTGPGPDKENWLFGIQPEGIGTVGMALISTSWWHGWCHVTRRRRSTSSTWSRTSGFRSGRSRPRIPTPTAYMSFARARWKSANAAAS